MRPKPKFHIGQIVGIRLTFSFGKIQNRGWFESGCSYEVFPVTNYTASGWYAEEDLRQLTKKEIGPR